jgi:choline dehydrogenase-like flavoprotein
MGGPALVGGGTLHYTAVTQVPHPVDYDVWAEATDRDWTREEVGPFAEEITRAFNIHAKPEELLCRGDRLFREAGQSMGYEMHPATIAKRNCLYSGYCDGFNYCKYDARLGSFMVYLPIAEEHGVEVIPDALVERVLFEKVRAGVRVKGLEYTAGGERKVLDVPKVVVCCSTFGTPTLLYRSGYGPKELVDGTPVVENPNVGQHTDNRPALDRLTAVFNEPLSNGEYHNGDIAGAYYLYHDLNPDKHLERIEISVYADELPSPDRAAIRTAAPEFGRAHKEYMRDYWTTGKMTSTKADILSRCGVDVSLVRPRSIRGSVTEWGDQLYQANDPSILKPLEQGRELAYELLKRMGAREVMGMDRPARVRRLYTYVGSCQPGSDRTNSVVDTHFESHDIDGLFICDASAVPRSATQGFAASVATVALFGASRIVQRHFRRG